MSKLINVQGVAIEHLPIKFQNLIMPQLDKNGGNVISVDETDEFGVWLKAEGFLFGNYSNGKHKGWEWLVVWR